MLLSSVDLYRYALPLTSPLWAEGRARALRHGLLIRFQSEEGAVGWGEAAPLPGFSEETLDDVVAAAEGLKAHLEGVDVPVEGGGEKFLRGLPQSDNCPPSLQFAIESAGVQLLAEVQGRSVVNVFGNSRDTIALNALIADPLTEGEEKASAVREAGYEAVKIKVGRASVDEEASCIRLLSEVLGDDVSLRLDANRAWSLDDALMFAESVGDVPVAYLEEPLKDPGKLPSLAAQTSLPLALDETTREVGSAVLNELSFVAAVVLKPTLLGGITVTQRWARQARRKEVLPVLSSSYESGVGLQVLAALASTVSDTPVGLSTYERLAADVLTSRLRMDRPIVAVDDLFVSSVEVDPSVLEPIGANS